MTAKLMLVASALALSACGTIQGAQMRLPSDLASTSERITIDGIGYGTRGDFRLADLDGRFTRSEERLAFFDTLEFRSGHTDFMLSAGMGGSMEASCRMRERNLDIGVLHFTPKRMAYRCDFTADGQSLPARFELQEVREGLGGAMMKRERRGQMAFGRVTLDLRSEHHMRGSPIALAAPIGYVFEHNGRAVASVDLNGRPTITMAAAQDPDLRKAILVGSVALALFWDPANSSL